MFENAPVISIIVPTYREEANLRPLLARIGAALGPRPEPYEVIIVDDDSRDGTDQAVRELAERFPVELIARTGVRDLSLAVLAGLDRARGRYLVVMDADLSHPPEQIPAMVALLADGSADFVIGSRYVSGGRTEDWGGRRRLNSLAATLLARPLTGRIRDPMAGFFALRRETFAKARERLDPIGYKIGLELICRCECRRVAEVPITFHNRVRGQSKLNLRQQALYLTHLDRLYRDYRRGWGLLLRPVLWMMLAAISTLQRLTQSG
ncbi:MAG: dolichol-phosphate mannosyltransferase [Phycisphaerae bacterium]